VKGTEETQGKSMTTLHQLAADFCHAFYEKQWPSDGAPDVSDLSIAESYRVQDLVAERRIALGERVVGYKVGCTSAAIREQFNLEEPIHGRLFYPHVQQSCQDVDWTDFVNCAIEPEMVLRIGRDLCGNQLSDEKLIDSIEYVSPGIELHNFRFWRTPPTTQELICSGGIHAGLIIGDEKVDPKELSFQSEDFSVFKDGRLLTSAPATEVMGGPLNSLRWLVKSLTAKGSVLTKGSYVIPGSPVELVLVDADTELKIQIEAVGALKVYFHGRQSQ
jgi:2-keto-4-pentenoate hydratase